MDGDGREESQVPSVQYLVAPTGQSGLELQSAEPGVLPRPGTELSLQGKVRYSFGVPASRF